MRMLLSALIFLVAAHSARAQTVADLPPSDRGAIHDAIAGQMQAFQRNDAEAAFAFATPNIQGMFGSAENFIAMVQSGYPMVWRPRSVDFGAIVDLDGHIVQKVEIIGPDGAPSLALYTMEKGPDGVWRIDGCALTASERVAA